jgi:hypothetical protein
LKLVMAGFYTAHSPSEKRKFSSEGLGKI